MTSSKFRVKVPNVILQRWVLLARPAWNVLYTCQVFSEAIGIKIQKSSWLRTTKYKTVTSSFDTEVSLTDTPRCGSRPLSWIAYHWNLFPLHLHSRSPFLLHSCLPQPLTKPCTNLSPASVHPWPSLRTHGRIQAAVNIVKHLQP